MNIFNCRYWQTEIAFARMLKHSLMQPCVHGSGFKEHSWESLKIMDTMVSFYDRIKKAHCNFQFGISDWTRKSGEDSLYSLSNKKPSHGEVLNKPSTVVGVPTLVREYSECYQNSQLLAVTGISSTCYGRIQNFRLRTLGVPVSNSNS